MKKALIFVVPLLLIAALLAPAFAEDNNALLPQAFAGWTKVVPDQISKDPAVADPTNAALLKEDGFTDFEQAEYTQPGRKITVKAARFRDSSGAYSAFTVYKEPDMTTVDMGGAPGESQGASFNNRVIFYRTNVLVQVTLDHITAMTAAELRELASLLPQAKGVEQRIPTLPTYLPKQSYVGNSAKYVMGAVGLSQVGSPLPADVIGFQQDAEVVLGKYRTGEGTATLILINYPTPAIAGEHERAIEALNQNPPPNTNPDTSAPFMVKRSGPMVAVTAGKISEGEAKSLLASVNYDAEVTWNQNTYLNKKDNVANLLVNIIVLIAILILLALGFGIAFGGVRLLVKRFFPGKVFDRPDETEIIQLKIGR
jgi:hypothetical protein